MLHEKWYHQNAQGLADLRNGVENDRVLHAKGISELWNFGEALNKWCGKAIGNLEADT